MSQNWGFGRPNLDIQVSQPTLSEASRAPAREKPAPKAGHPLDSKVQSMIPNYSLDYECNPYRTLERLSRDQ
jgi:hypothetical protein